MTVKPVIGWREWVALPELDIDWVKAKVDTGARSSSLDAVAVRVDEAAGVVRFEVRPRQESDDAVAVQAPLVDFREVRSSNGEVERRPVVSVRAVVAGVDLGPIEVTLTDRDEMGFAMLLGRSAVRRRFLIDPGRSFFGGGGRRCPPEV